MKNIFFVFVFFVFMGSVTPGLAESPFDEEVEKAIQSPDVQHLFSKYAKTDNADAMRLYKEGTYLINNDMAQRATIKKERIKEGMNRLQKALELDPNFAVVHLSLGQALIFISYMTRDIEERQSLYEKAKDEVRKALELDPKNPDAHVEVAEFSDNVKERIYHMKMVLELDPQQDVNMLDRARVAESMGKVNEAFEYLVQGLKWTPVKDRCHEVKTLPGEQSAEQYGFLYFKKKYPKKYEAFVKKVCSGEGLPEYEPPSYE